MTALADIIKKHITIHGPMDVGTFMNLALGHPEHGYYMKQDPFGEAGDFTTAPEISQMFGEMIGAWTADLWMKMGEPEAFTLLECGPGRGTLMADIMRSVKMVSGFQDAAQIHLLETSPVLKDKQAQVLGEYEPQFHETLEHIPDDQPLIVIANEFLDALPIRQFIGGKERYVMVGPDDQLTFSGLGEVQEVAPVRDNVVRAIAALLKNAGGAALFIDYGHAKTAPGDTLQALYKHEYCSVFEHIGDADITAHVDFEAVRLAADEVEVYGPVEQGAFLQALGIGIRAQALMQAADEDQRTDIETALHRLIAPDQMGSLFKVIGLSYGDGIIPAGFSA